MHPGLNTPNGPYGFERKGLEKRTAPLGKAAAPSRWMEGRRKEEEEEEEEKQQQPQPKTAEAASGVSAPSQKSVHELSRFAFLGAYYGRSVRERLCVVPREDAAAGDLRRRGAGEVWETTATCCCAVARSSSRAA